ncbi:hypothetical protein VNO77_40581 [Canavalia gladiata]|uniref:Uncharacterized protein n=1 Tax=Canavalia gladiata TaxID=3824 RepID=A0AAN9JYZ8_CANGL
MIKLSYSSQPIKWRQRQLGCYWLPLDEEKRMYIHHSFIHSPTLPYPSNSKGSELKNSPYPMEKSATND